jgi:putative DNA primase/helicase
MNDDMQQYEDTEEKRDTVSAGLDYLQNLQARLQGDKDGHLGAWAAIQRPEALGDIADAWVSDEGQVTGILAVIELIPGQVTRCRALRSALKRLVTERRRASLDRVIGVVNDNTLISLGVALGAGAPPASLVEPHVLDAFRVPRGYTVDPTGVFKLSILADGSANATRVATAPIFIVGRTHDVLTGTAKRLLMWRTPAGWTVRPIDRGVLMNGQKLIGLADLEVPVTSNTSGAVVEWLAEFEAENMHRFAASQAASRMGWIRQGGMHGFLLPDAFYTTAQSEEGGVELSPQPGLESVLEGWKPGGTWEGWLEAMDTMRPFTPMWVALYASCAAPMLEILGSPSFIVDFNGETSSGKTTAMRVAASVWGRPADNMPTAMYSWDATKVFIERICGFLCHLPVILDETKRAKDTKVVRDVVYDFANGQGRGRGAPDGTRQTASWRSVMLTSGESAATSFSQDGGTRARVLSITGKPMGVGMKVGGQAAELLAAQIAEHYGHLGRRLMHYLVSVADQHEALREVWRDTRDQYAAVARTAVSRRHAGNLATLHLASTIVHESLGVPYPEEDPMAFALEAVMQIETEKDRPHAAFIEVVGWCAANQNRFWGRHETDRDGNPRVPGRGWAGAWDNRESWQTINIMPHALREVLEPIGFQVEEILDRWAERGWLVHSESTRNGKTIKSRTTVTRINGAPMRVYQFSRSSVDNHVAEDEVVRGDAD